MPHSLLCSSQVDYDWQAGMFRLLGNPSSWDEVLFGEGDKEEGGAYSMDEKRNKENLPSTPCDFIGRSKEVYDLVRLVRESRITTLAGTFGMGKSSIAVEGARYLWDREHFEAVVYVKVGSVVDLWPDIEDRLRQYFYNDEHGAGYNSDDAGSTVNYGNGSVWEGAYVDLDVLRGVRDRDVLLVLDGAEGMIDKGAIRGFRNVVRSVLEHTSGTKIVVTTSREAVGRLHKSRESLLEIKPMDDKDIATMMMMRAPVLRKGFRGREEFVEAVSKHKVVTEYVLGNPFRVGLVATLLQRGEIRSSGAKRQQHTTYQYS